MEDRIIKLFSLLARQHYYLYLVIGVALALLIGNYVEIEYLIVFIKVHGDLIIFGFTIIIGAYYVFRNLFYRQGQLKQLREQRQVTRYGFIKKDLYFAAEVDSRVERAQKILGYFYVIFRVFHSLIHGFVFGVIVFWFF